MRQATPTCITIAGHDPSDGAGLARDVLTFEAIGVSHFSVCTALTIQDSQTFNQVKWIDPTFIEKQLHFIIYNHNIKAIKIGIIENVNTLLDICTFIKKHDDGIAIVWDPILRSSTGFTFHALGDPSLIQQICNYCSVITPNRNEIRQLMIGTDEETSAQLLSQYCPVLLKGGHDAKATENITDILYSSNSEIKFTRPKLDTILHGTGCRYSAALCAYISEGETLANACKYAGDFVYSHLLKQSLTLTA